jgi:hypothetical protein
MEIYHCQEHGYFKYLDEIAACPWCEGKIEKCSTAPEGEKLREDAPIVVSGGKPTTLISGGRRTVNMPEFSKVVFCSGSISYKHSKEKYPRGELRRDLDKRSKEWTYHEFGEHAYSKLSKDKKLLDSGDWQYLCTVKPPPVWEAGLRNFRILKLPVPKKADLKDKDIPPPFVGFPSTSVLRNALWRGLQTEDKNFVEFQGTAVTYRKDSGGGVLSNSSSAVPKDYFDKFVTRLTSAGLGFPVFSLSDCNCFHNSAYLWGLYSLSMAHAGDTTPLIILNFDQHIDAGMSKTEDVASLGWGVPLLRNAVSGCYMSIGNDTRGATYAFLKKPDPSAKSKVEKQKSTITDLGKAPLKGVFLNNHIGKLGKAQIPEEFVRAFCGISADQDGKVSGDWQTWWDELHTMLGKPACVYVFIAVDRDCLTGHHTQWQNNRTYFKKVDDLVNCMKTALKSLENVQNCLPLVIGMDVCGLPEHAALTEFVKMLDETNEEKIDKESEVWDGMRAELKEYLEFIQPNLRSSAVTIKPKVQVSHTPKDSVKAPPQPVIDKLNEFLIREKLAEGWASGADNNCLLHTLHQLIHDEPAEAGKVSDEAQKWIDEKREDVVRKNLAAQYQQLDVYGKEAEIVLAEIGKESKFKYKVVEYNTNSRDLLEGPELGEGDKLSYILWRGASRNSGHFVPLWPQQ